jgi:hypothetical protein
MNEGIQIQLNRDRLNPGEKLAGQACWQLAKAPRMVAIRLFWKTSGKGTEDVGLVDERRVEVADQQQSADFCFQLPIEPYSYEGHLVSITWGVEVLAGKVSAVATFVMAPEGAARRSNNPDPEF